MISALGKRLADTDPVIRSRTFKKLRNACKKPVADFSELLRLWRSLWYALWMADKRPNQTLVAVEAVQLGQVYDDAGYVLWTRAFFETVVSMWSKLDKWRMDKYLLLLRVFIAESFRRLRLSGWSSDFVDQFNAEISALGRRCLGAAMHVARVFWEELDAEISRADAPVDFKTLSRLLDGMSEIATTSNYHALVRRVCEDVFLHEKFPIKIARPLVKKLNARALQKDLNDQDIRDVLCSTSEKLSGSAL